jgi:hypothetical protein
MEKALKDLLVDTVTIYAEAALDEYGRRSDGAGKVYPARVQMGRRQVPLGISPQGRYEYADGQLYLDGKVDTTVNAGMVLSTGDRIRVMNVEWMWDDKGVHHTVVYFGLNGTAD